MLSRNKIFLVFESGFLPYENIKEYHALHSYRVNYIKEVYETIVTRDFVQKYALPDTLVLQHLSEFLMGNISNLTSPNKVSQLLTANRIPTNHVTIGKYIKYLCNAFVFYHIKRYDIRGKKYLESSIRKRLTLSHKEKMKKSIFR